MFKLIPPNSWDFGEVPSSLIKFSSRGLLGRDRALLEKRAGAQFAHLAVQRWEKMAGELPLHLIAMGSTEGYGSNRNGDGFSERELIKHSHTFEKHARFYRHHKNKNPQKSYGRVVLAFYNPEMRRTELLVGLNETKEAADRNGGLVADDEVAMIKAGKDLAVSMACLTDSDYPVLTRERGYVPVNQVVVGDYVYTHEARWRRVKEINRRTYTGKVYKFYMNGLPFPLEVTADHPMWARVFAGSREAAAVKAKARRFFTDRAAFDKEPAGWCHAEHVGVGDRFFYQPVGKYSGFGRLHSVDMAALLGYFTAEGSFGYNGESPCTINFSCNLGDSAVREIPKILERIYPGITVNLEPTDNSEYGISVNVYSTQLGKFIKRLCGAGCRSKYVPPEIFNAEDQVKLAYLGAWLDGDGWVDKKGTHWSTASVNLVLQGRDLLASLGIAASIYRIDHANCETSGMPGSDVEYTLNVSHLDSWRLAEYSYKVADYPLPQTRQREKPPCLRLCPDGRYAVRIKQVEIREVVDCPTYNFEVEDDESYLAAGLISHNCRVPHDTCSICGNQAPRREDYCKSAEEGGDCPLFGCWSGLTKVGSDGRVQFVHNPEPDFFDISRVGRNADPIAWGSVANYLTKAAGQNGVFCGGAELAETCGLVPSLEVALRDCRPEVADQVKLAYGLASLEDQLEESQFRSRRDQACALAFSPAVQPPLDLAPLGKVGSQQFASGLAALADQQVLLSVDDFVGLFQGREKSSSLTAQVAGCLPGIYNRLLASGNLGELVYRSPFTPARGLVTSAQRQWANKCAETHSLDPSRVQQRATLAAIRGESPRVKQASNSARVGDSQDANRLAGAYALYKLAFLQAQPRQLLLTAELVVRQNYL